MKALQQTQLTLVIALFYAGISFSSLASTEQVATTEQAKPAAHNVLEGLSVNEEPNVVIPKLASVNTDINSPTKPDSNDAADASENNASVEKPSPTKPLATSPTLFLAHVDKSENKFIPMIQDAIIFANFDDELPAIVNYYTYETEANIISFYQAAFGEILNQEQKRNRLTLYFNQNEQAIRVIISPQDKKHQVDVMITKR